MITLFRLLIASSLWLPTAAMGASPEVSGIRAVQTDTTDVFEVLSLLQDAQAALGRRDYMTARQGFEAVLLHDPTVETARSGLRRTLIAVGDIQSAAKWIDDRKSSDALIIGILTNQVETPKTALKLALQTEADPRLWTLLGRLHDQADDFSAARQAYAMSGLAGARVGLADNNIGHSHWISGEIDEALTAFSRAASADPTDSQFDNNRRRALVALGRTAEAVEGLGATRAGIFLAQAGDRAFADGELRLAKVLYRKSLSLSPRHNPSVAQKIAQLDNAT